MNTPLLGYIPPSERTPAQQATNDAAIAAMPFFTLQPPVYSGAAKVVLPTLWKNPEIVAALGFEFTGFRQLTGSCVGVSAGEEVFTLAAVQFFLGNNATKPFLPWWPFFYGRCRLAGGDRGEGEGAFVSVMAQTLVREGCFSVDEISDEPSFNTSDGFSLTARQEMTYSAGNYQGNTKYLELARTHPVGTAAPLRSSQDIKAAVVNGYSVANGYALYVGNGRMQGDRAVGKYDGRGGHATSFLGYEDHPNLGPLYLYCNQWGGNTYPQDNSGKPRCAVWLPEAEVDKMLRDSDGETFAYSHLSYFPAQPRLLDLFW